MAKARPSKSQVFSFEDYSYEDYVYPWVKDLRERESSAAPSAQSKEDAGKARPAPFYQPCCANHYPPCPNQVDLALPDIDRGVLCECCANEGMEYLGLAEVFPAQFPVKGRLVGPNKRPMINLACRRQKKRPGEFFPVDVEDEPDPINVAFVISSAPLYTYFSAEAWAALKCRPLNHQGRTCPLSGINVQHIHENRTLNECYMSWKGSGFEGVNVLGSQFFRLNRLTIDLDYTNDTVNIYKFMK